MADTDLSAYLLGRQNGVLTAPYKGRDLAFGAVRLDGQQINGGDFSHCTFANISFKQVVLCDTSFLNCLFIGCYFRRAELRNSRFVGCRFIDCNFGHIAVKSCDFKHSSFHGCQMPFSEFRHSFPPEPNLREELARNLALESSRLGLSSEARQFRMAEIQACEANLLAAIKGDSTWYKEHFDGFARARSATQLILSLGNRWLWGYGERAWVLVRNLLILGLLVFPSLLFLLRDGLTHSIRAEIGFQDVLFFSLQNILPGGIQSGVTAIGFAARMVSGLESVLGVVALALFASYVFRWSLHR